MRTRPSPRSRRPLARLFGPEQLEDRSVPSLLGSTFESNDGNLVVNGAAPALDWANAPNLVVALDRPTGQTDDSFGTGTKEDMAVPSVVAGSIPNNKSDLTRFYVSNETANDSVFAYVAWERANTLGTADIDFEFNQSTALSSNGSTPVRTAGDLLISFDFSSSGNTTVITLRKWQASGSWGAATNLTAAGFAEGAVNNGFTVTDPVAPGAPRTLASRTFGEAAINLTAAGVFPPDQCEHFVRVYAKSRASDSFTAEMKDFVAPVAISIDNCPDLHVVKTADRPTINAGDTAAFTITVSNEGGGAAQNVVVSDPLPAGVTWTTSTPGATISNGTLTYTAPTLAPHQSATIRVAGPTTAANRGTLTNTASATTSSHEDPADLGDNTSTAVVTVLCPDLRVVKTADASPISTGDTAGFTITLSNVGPGTAYNVSLTDQLPPGVNWTTTSPGFTISNGVLGYTASSLAAGGSVSVHVTGPTGAANAGAITNTASAAASNEAADTLADNTSTASITVRSPDLRVVKTADASPISAGDTAGFTIVVTNVGQGNAYGVALTDPLPAGVAWSTSAGAITNGVLSDPIGTLAPGQSVTVHVTGTTASANGGTLANTASASAPNEASDLLGNNSSSASITVYTPDLAVTKTADAAAISTGDVAGFVVTVSNQGQGNAYNVSLADQLPAGVSWTASAGTISNGVLTLPVGTLAPGGSASVHVTGTTAAANAGTLNNTASATASNEPAGALANNSAAASVAVRPPDVQVTKTAVQPTINTGDTAAFTITVINLGPGNAYNVTLTDSLPAGVSWAVSTGTVVNGVLTVPVGTLGVNQGVVVTVSGVTTAANAGTIANTASASASNEPSAALGNNSSTATIAVQAPDLRVVKTADAASVSTGDIAGFTITLSNAGAGTAYGTVLTDTLPGGVAWTASAGSISGGVLTLPVGSLAAGGSVSVHVTGATSAANAGTITNTASALASNEPSNLLADDSSTATVTVLPPDVRVVKTADASAVSAGDVAGFTITVTNIGQGNAYGVSLTDPLPAGVNWATTTSGAGISNGVLSDAIGTLTPGQAVSVRVTGATSAANAGTLTNTASATATNEPAGVLGNNTSTATVAVLVPDLRVTKTAHVGTADTQVGAIDAGAVAAFTVTLTNAGQGTAYNVGLTDPLPAGVPWSIDGTYGDAGQFAVSGSAGNQVLSFTGTTLAAGASRTVRVTAPTASLDCGKLLNAANAVVSNEPSATLADNRGAALILVNPVVTAADTAFLGNLPPVPPPVSPPGPFEIDGNLVANGAAPAKDWANAPNLVVGVDRPTGQTDDSFGTGTKEDTAVPSVVAGSIPNNKSDLTRFYVADQLLNDHAYLYLAWERANTLGTANVDFEFDQSTALSSNGVTPVRTPGDLLIGFDFANGGNTVALTLRKWLASGQWSAATDLSGPGYASGAVNDPAFGPQATNVTDPLTGQALARDTFGEASIDLTAAGVFSSSTCVHFGRAYVKSRSSTSFTAEMKDFIAPIPVNIDSCPNVVVLKTAHVGTNDVRVGTIDAGAAAAFTVTIRNDGFTAATGVTLTDRLPPLGGSSMWTIDGSYGDAGLFAITGPAGAQVLTLTGASTLGPGRSLTVRVVGPTGALDADGCGKLRNEVLVSAANEPADDAGDDRGAAIILVDPVVTAADRMFLDGRG